jgi:hypothetical protein
MKLMSTAELKKRAQKEAAGFIIVIALIVAAWLLSGCTSMSTVSTFDPKTGITTTVNDFKGDLATAVVFDLKDKIVFDFTNGMAVRAKIEPPSKENPMGIIVVEYANGAIGHISIPKDCDLSKCNPSMLAKMITASMGKNLSMSATGINTTDQTETIEEPKTVPTAEPSTFKLLEPISEK